MQTSPDSFFYGFFKNKKDVEMVYRSRVLYFYTWKWFTVHVFYTFIRGNGLPFTCFILLKFITFIDFFESLFHL